MGFLEKVIQLPEWAATPAGVRTRARQGLFNGNTSGMAPGYGQGNLVILPKRWAEDFYGYCQSNTTPCPLIGMTEPGSPAVPMLGEDIDLRTDLPRYRVWRDGELVEELDDVSALWQNDFVGFVLGCSLSFEYALEQAGLRVRHVDEGKIVPMYRTSIQTTRVGVFHGPMVPWHIMLWGRRALVTFWSLIVVATSGMPAWAARSHTPRVQPALQASS